MPELAQPMLDGAFADDGELLAEIVRALAREDGILVIPQNIHNTKINAKTLLVFV